MAMQTALIKKIQDKIEDKKELSFLHSGTSGDIINSLPIIKELSSQTTYKIRKIEKDFNNILFDWLKIFKKDI